MIIFSDLHLRPESESIVFDEVLPAIYEAAMQSDKEIACLGDIYHTRHQISVRLQNRLYAWLHKASRNGCFIRLLAGNHDQINGNGESALRVFGAIANVQVIESPMADEWGDWIPYYKEDFETWVTSIIPSKERRLFIHQGVLGARMSDFRLDDSGINTKVLHGFYVISGHYHLHHTLGNVVYVGSPYQIDAGESGQTKGYLELNRKGDWSFSSLSAGIRYYREEGLTLEKAKSLTFTDKDEVRAIVKEGEDIDAIHRALSATGATVILRQEEKPTEQRLQVGQNASLREYAEEYVRQFCGEFNPDELLGVLSRYEKCIF